MNIGAASERILGQGVRDRAMAGVAAWATRLDERSRVFVARLPGLVERIIPWWLAAFMALATLRVLLSPSMPETIGQFAEIFVPYALVALSAPLAWRIGMAAFPPDRPTGRLSFSLARFGRWRRIDRLEAQSAPLYGPSGFMASLLLGLLVNVVIRSFEFLLAVPALNSMAPDWARTIFLVMAFDVFAMSFLYVTCFVMALRTVPLFPRMLGLVWMLDLAFQFGIARTVMRHEALPAEVALALSELLSGNLTKVLISIGIWLPYLLMSKRINLTYRHRLPA